MTFLDRLAIQLVEARRMAKDGGTPRGRLALLLLDNAAETLLRSSADTYLDMAVWYGRLYRQVESAAPEDARGQQLKTEIAAKVVSERRRKKIEREFDTLVDFVFEQQDWPLGSEFADCLKVLHRFRNAAYHQDKVRPDVLSPAVIIYSYLVAHLLHHRRAIAHVLEPAPPGVKEFMEGQEIHDDYLGLPTQHSGQLEDLMAERLLRDFELDHGGIAQVLGGHLLGRLNDIDRGLNDIADYLYGLPTGARQFATRVAQCDPSEWAAPQPPADFWDRDVPVTVETLSDWRDSAEALKAIDNALTALGTFGGLEREIATFETQVSRLATEVDRAIQFQIDVARGK